jgi:hypothetical protein
MLRTTVTHEFVDYIPDDLGDGVVYVCIQFATAVHKCCCGCGREVVTPLSPTDWKFIFDGETISLDPSIGNWSFPCQSHYWIRHDKVVPARRWSRHEIEAGRTHDRYAKETYFDVGDASTRNDKGINHEKEIHDSPWKKLKKWF